MNVGCISTKTLAKSAEIIHNIKKAKTRGIEVPGYSIDMMKVKMHKDRVVQKLSGGVTMLLRAHKVDLVQAEAKVISLHEISANDQGYEFDNLIIATGSENLWPAIKGIELPGLISSTEILDLVHIPESLTIIGGGIIGCELASIFNEFGSEVTIIERLPRLIANTDEDISRTLSNRFNKDGINVLTSSNVTEITRVVDRYHVYLEGIQEPIESSEVLISVGCSGNVKGLESLGLELKHGFIRVNEELKTNHPHIYAIGDVTGKLLLAHVASAQAIAAVENIGKHASAIDYQCIPSCIYTTLEIGTVGLSEHEASAIHPGVISVKFPMTASGKALAMDETEGFVKVVADKATKQILGCHIVGPNATGIIGQMVVLITQNIRLDDAASIIQAHPTISETVSEAIHMALGHPIHII